MADCTDYTFFYIYGLCLCMEEEEEGGHIVVDLCHSAMPLLDVTFLLCMSFLLVGLSINTSALYLF